MHPIHVISVAAPVMLAIVCVPVVVSTVATDDQSTTEQTSPKAQGDAPKTNDAQADASKAQVLYDSPQDAAVGLVDAIRQRDFEALRAVLGPDVDRLRSGDLNVDDEDLQRFIAAYDARNSLIEHDNGTYTLAIGLQGWRFPVPIVGLNGKWWFDGEQGIEEVLNRTIGAHELRTIAVCRKYPLIQRIYYKMDPDGDAVKSYATKITSSPGKRDGLFWPDVEGQPLSPIGSQVAQAYASGELHKGSDKPDPYYGYFYRILTSQGSAAPGGAMNYIDESGRMTRGFALIAWPAEYDNSGVMTFIVSSDGIVYERDFGDDTAAQVKAIDAYKPSSEWKPVAPTPKA